MKSPNLLFLGLLFIISSLFLHNVFSQHLPIEKLKLPQGFQVSVYSDKVPSARQMALSPKTGIVYVGSFDEGKIYAVVPNATEPSNPSVYIIADGLHLPVGVAYSTKSGSLFVSQVDTIYRFDNIDNTYMNRPNPNVAISDLPNKDHHGWKYIRLNENEDQLWVPIGSPCNICEDVDPFGKLWVYPLNATSGKVIGEPKAWAEGIRNTVGFDFHPESGELWFTENGRDEWGDDRPGDELNHAPVKGLHFGFPYCYEKDLCDPTYNNCTNPNPCGNFTSATFVLGPHVAAIGMKFYRGTQFPDQYNKRVFIAEHGSWNREVPIGYRITSIDIEDPQSYSVFVEGWLQPGSSKHNGRIAMRDGVNDSPNAWGRPADIINLPDGSILVSDDKAGALYKITYEGK